MKNNENVGFGAKDEGGFSKWRAHCKVHAASSTTNSLYSSLANYFHLQIQVFLITFELFSKQLIDL